MGDTPTDLPATSSRREGRGTLSERERSPRLDPRFVELGRTGDRDLRNTLVEEHRWLAVHCARRFSHKGEPLEDLVQVAMVGLLKAVDRFDPRFGVVFSTFAVPTVTGELRRHFRDTTWSVHVPRRAKELHQTVSGVVDELSQQLGRSPTVPEMAQRAGITVEETLEALEVHGCYRGLPMTAPDDEGVHDETTLGNDDPGYASTDAKLTVRKVLGVLSTERDRQLIKMRFVDRLTQSQIAAEMGCSQVHVSRLLRANLTRMRRALRQSP